MRINPPIRGSIGVSMKNMNKMNERINPPIRGSIDKTPYFCFIIRYNWVSIPL